MTPTIWTALWLLWGGAFALIEGIAVTNDHKDDTLSEHLRLWFRTDTKRGRTVWLVVSGGFLGWFLLHIAWAGFA